MSMHKLCPALSAGLWLLAGPAVTVLSGLEGLTKSDDTVAVPVPEVLTALSVPCAPV